MSTKTCFLNEWRRKLPKIFQIKSFSYYDLTIEVDTPFLLLAGGCHVFLTSGVLTADKIRKLGVKWINTNIRTMDAPRHVSGPCYISNDGSGNTPISRLEWLAEKIGADSTKCVIEYVEDLFAGFDDTVAKVKAGAWLHEWEGGSAMPPNAVQIDFSRIDSGSASSLYPYKLVIGGDQYEVENWKGCVNAFIAYLYCKYPNGPSRLLDICKENWGHQKFVVEKNGEIDISHIDDSCTAKEIADVIVELTERIGLDKYSASIVCIPNSKNNVEGPLNPTVKPNEGVHRGKLPEDKVEEPVPVCIPDDGGNEVDSRTECEDEVFVRHFRPRITVVQSK